MSGRAAGARAAARAARPGVALVAALVLLSWTSAGAAGKTTAEELGHPPDARLLVVNADDAGLSHGVNQATIRALEGGLVTSATAMAPAPWFAEFAAYAKAHPDLDVGLHLCLTSEWDTVRWGPLLPRDRVPSLVAPDGYFYGSREEVDKHAKLSEARAEFRAQIDLALKLGMRLTHLDSHMGVYHFRMDLFQAVMELANEYCLPMRVVTIVPLRMARRQRVTATDHWIMRYEAKNEQREEMYREILRGLKPGLTELTIHLAQDDEEWKGVAGADSHSHALRLIEQRFFTAPETRRLMEEQKIVLVGWRPLAALMRKWQAEDGPEAVKARAGKFPAPAPPGAPAESPRPPGDQQGLAPRRAPERRAPPEEEQF